MHTKLILDYPRQTLFPLSTYSVEERALVRIWYGMLYRCYHPRYKDYNGRGIEVAPEWHIFDIFYKDVGLRPSLELSLDRIDNDKGYFPGNVRWADRSTQAKNKRSPITVPFKKRNMATVSAYEKLRLRQAADVLAWSECISDRDIAIAFEVPLYLIKDRHKGESYWDGLPGLPDQERKFLCTKEYFSKEPIERLQIVADLVNKYNYLTDRELIINGNKPTIG